MEDLTCSYGLGLCQGDLKDGRCRRCSQKSRGQTKQEQLLRIADRNNRFFQARKLRPKQVGETRPNLLSEQEMKMVWGA